MRILVTGAKGMLGTDLMKALKEKHTTVGIDIDELDITDLAETLVAVKEAAPDVVINCAAYTNVDGCETNEETAYKVNAFGPRNLAVACEQTGAALVHISTDYVFPGNGNRPYREDDLTGPKSVYGCSKLAGENNVRTMCSRYYIVRTSWLFGANGPNFVKTILRIAGEGNPLSIVNDQLGSPTYTRDLADALAALITQPAYGTYHLTNSNHCSWYEFTRQILEMAGLANEVAPISSEEFKRPAPRPAYSVLDNFNWRLMGYEPLRDYKAALRDYLVETGVIVG